MSGEIKLCEEETMKAKKDNTPTKVLVTRLTRFLAFFRLSDTAICTASKGMGLNDYHDYPDDEQGEPQHFFELTCKRCGKRFKM